MLPQTMKAVCFYRYGSPEELVIEEFPVPTPKADEVLIKMLASAFSPADAKARNGWYSSMFDYKFPRIPGIEIAGTVAAVGSDVKDFSVGEQVIAFGDKRDGGALAEYCAVKAAYCCRAPKKVDLCKVAAIPGYALTAVQAMTEEAPLQPGQRLLVLGAAGGVGQLVVQFAKYVGAYVIGCDMAECKEAVLANGADEFIAARSNDYRQYKAAPIDVVFSVITLDEAGLADYLGIMAPGGYFVSTVPLKDKIYTGPDYDGKRGLTSLCLSKEMEKAYGVHCVWMTVRRGTARLERVVELLDAGAIRPIISRVATFADYKQVNYDFEAGNLRGRCLVLIEGHT